MIDANCKGEKKEISIDNFLKQEGQISSFFPFFGVNSPDKINF